MRIVSFSRVVPYEGIPHAGGEYFLRHLIHLLKKHEVVVIAPDTPRNRAAIAQHQTRARIVLAGGYSRRGRGRALVSRLYGELRPASAPQTIVQNLRAGFELSELVKSADLIEFQWSENASLSRIVRRINPTARLIVIMHDVLTQKYSRRLRSSRGIKQRIRALLAYLAARLLEPRRLRRVNDVIVLSEKDSDLVATSNTRAKISVVTPPLTSAPSIEQTARQRFGVLFTGAMDRPENDWGIQWFIRECWPQIVQAEPQATLTIAGALPSRELFELAADYASINITGYVPDLDSYYTTARVFIVPLFQGAGVKFKTISAMLNGIPVVSTPIGAEGVGESSLFGAVTDHADTFARAVIRTIGDDAYWSTLSMHARTWAATNYGLQRFHESLDKIYDQPDSILRSSH